MPRCLQVVTLLTLLLPHLTTSTPTPHLPHKQDRADLAYNEAVDAWAMGVLAYELIVGRPPFGMADRESTMRAITGMQPFIPEWMSGGAASFITMALEKSPATRAPIARLIQHPWIAMHTRTKWVGGWRCAPGHSYVRVALCQWRVCWGGVKRKWCVCTCSIHDIGRRAPACEHTSPACLCQQQLPHLVPLLPPLHTSPSEPLCCTLSPKPCRDSLIQQQASTLQHAVQRLARPARGLNSGLSNSFTSSRLPQTSSADLSAGTGSISAAAAAAAVAVAQHQAQALGKPSPVLSSSGGFGSAGSSMTGSGWHAGGGGGMTGSPARAAIAAAAAAAVQQMDCSDLRPAKRLLQQRPGSHASDGRCRQLPPLGRCSLQLAAWLLHHHHPDDSAAQWLGGG